MFQKRTQLELASLASVANLRVQYVTNSLTSALSSTLPGSRQLEINCSRTDKGNSVGVLSRRELKTQTISRNFAQGDSQKALKGVRLTEYVPLRLSETVFGQLSLGHLQERCQKAEKVRRSRRLLAFRQDPVTYETHCALEFQ